MPSLAASALAKVAGSCSGGRGDRASWCYWRSHIVVKGLEDGEARTLCERGRVLNSAVVGYREEQAGFVSVMLNHDHVSHRYWDCEYRAMARTAAAARLLLSGRPESEAKAALETGAALPPKEGEHVFNPVHKEIQQDAEASVEGCVEIHMTEVPFSVALQARVPEGKLGRHVLSSNGVPVLLSSLILARANKKGCLSA
eukprot:1196277-Amphidinium_carterae.1